MCDVECDSTQPALRSAIAAIATQGMIIMHRYLFKSTSAGVQDYLCNRLYSLSEAGIERYLLQLGQLVLTRPHSSLERVLIDLCARSLRLAVKVGCACSFYKRSCGACQS